MCGIAGYFNISHPTPVSQGVLKGMCDAIVHRGPDDDGFFIEGSLAMGMRRLSIIDVAGGHQPIQNDSQEVTIVFNGEIFNHNDLRKELQTKGYTFRTKSDTETILRLYEEYGVGCVDMLRGMFAFAIWDTKKQELFIARDRLGVKPLFYAEDKGRFIFGSEIKSIFQVPDVNREIDWTAVDAFFAYTYIPAPLSAYKAIKKLLPGHYMQVSKQGVKIHQYWDVEFGADYSLSENQWKEGFIELLRPAVDMRLMSEVPIGCFLSGGVDSSLIVAMIALTGHNNFQTFSIGFGGQKGDFMDERVYAEEVSRRYKTNHHVFEVQPEVDTIIDAIVRAFDEPFADDSVIPTYHICRMAKEHVTVVLTGLGGDENFAGYERHLGFKISNMFGWVPRILLNGVINPIVQSLKEEKGGHYRVNHLKRFTASLSLPPDDRYLSYLMTAPTSERAQWYHPDIRKQIDFELVSGLGKRYFNACKSDDLMDKMLYQDIKMYLSDDLLALSDRVGMAHSMELRVPFIDHKVVEYCARIPSSLKIKWRDKKHLLKQAARPYLPDSVLDHRKQGFASPMAIWLRNDLKAYIDRELDKKKIGAQGIFNPATIENMLVSHNNRTALNDKKIFSMFMAQRWLATLNQ